MRKITSFLICLLLVLVGTMLLLKTIGVTGPAEDYFLNENIQSDNLNEVKEDSDQENTILPEYYNCMDNYKISKTRDQGELGSCWAFAVTAALESRLLPYEEWDFSEDHMLNNNGFASNAYEGGDFFMALAYLSAWKGPVTEEDDPYNDGQTNPSASVVKHLQESVILKDADTQLIKEFIYKYGAVESAVYMAVDNQYIDETYYNKYDYSYCYNGTENSNHEIVIIGWDDNYPAENFNVGAAADGAYICMNSWGTQFGDGGIFYVSYCDTNIGSNIEVYTKLENAENYDHIYQYDPKGWVGRMGFENERAFFANVYTTQNDELLKAVSFYATDKQTSYAVYICREYNGESDLSYSRELAAKGSFDYAGYYTVELDEELYLNAGTQFAVIVEIMTPSSQFPVAIEMDSGDGRTGSIDIEGKYSYISPDGRNWDNTQEKLESNVCLKVFTVDR